MEADRPSGGATIETLMKQLQAVAERLVPGAYGVPASYRQKRLEPLTIDELSEIVERLFPEEWQKGKVTALECTLRKAIGQLEGAFSEVPAGNGRRRSRVMTNQEAALRYFNLRSSSPKVEPVDFEHPEYESVGGGPYNKVAYSLRRETGVGQKELTPELLKLRRKLAAIIIKMASPAPATTVESATSSSVVVTRSVLADEYIPRLEYEQQIRQLRDAGELHVWLWGDAGTGKTKLAQAANRDLVPERDVLVLPCRDEEALREKLTDQLIQLGVSGAEINPFTSWALLCKQLADGRLPKVVVFDDLADIQRIQRLTDVSHGGFLVFTSVARPPEEYQGAAIEVRNMTTAEATQMIRSRLPELTDADVELLNVALDGRPLAIEHSCSHLRKSGMSVTAYCAALARDPAETLTLAGSRPSTAVRRSPDRTLTRAYELTLELMADSPTGRNTLRALDYVLFSIPGLLTEEMLQYLWADRLPVRSADEMALMLRLKSPDVVANIDAVRWPGVVLPPPTQFAFLDPNTAVALSTALEELTALGLVRINRGLIVMHQLTHRLLSALRREHRASVSERVVATVLELLDIDGWESGEPLSLRALMWLARITSLVREVDADAAYRLPPERLAAWARLAAMVLRGHQQLGFDMSAAFVVITRVHAAVLARVVAPAEMTDAQQHLHRAWTGLAKEATIVTALQDGFTRAHDAGPAPGTPVEQAYRSLAQQTRWENDTEWQQVHLHIDIEDLERQAGGYQHNAVFLRRDRATLLDSALVGMRKSRAYDQQCRWRDAIGALEHAFSCYLKISGDLTALRGAIDAARRLARVHLRAGPGATLGGGPTDHLDTAKWWLIRAAAVKTRRSDWFVNGKPSRYRLQDVLLDAQLRQALDEIELTRHVLAADGVDDDGTDQARRAMVSYITEPFQQGSGHVSPSSRLAQADETLALLHRVRALPLMPEFRLHAARLCALVADQRGGEHLDVLDEWFHQDESAYQYQRDLLRVQRNTLTAPSVGIFLLVGEDPALLANVQNTPTDKRNQVLDASRDPIGTIEQFHAAARQMDKWRNPYWYARGLVATFLLGLAAERESSWLNAAYQELKQAAAVAGRPDWVEAAKDYGITNTGLWLVGY